MSTEIESLELKIKSNSKSAAKGIDALTQSLTNLKSATKGGLGLAAVATGISNIGTAANRVSIASQSASLSFTEMYHKMTLVTKGVTRVGKTIYSYVKKSSEYMENVNLFTVSMGEYADEAQKYAETVGEIMGIDPGEWMRNQGVFMTLATGFGVAGDRAAVMSKNLTQLGYDLSSFFNIEYDEAMKKLQSGLSGELEPLRRIGYDLSQAKLEATALELGIDKAVSSMTQAEKAELRYYAIMTQVTTAHGDMARTLDAPANQMKVFTSQVNMAAREIGNIFIPMLNAVMPYAIAVAKVIRYLASTIASLVGFEMPEVDYSGVDAMGNASEDTSNALEDATDSAKKLKSYMMGFDELNVINPNSGDTDEALGAGFDFELPEYDFMDGLIESKVATIVEEMKEWLGLTEDIDSWSELFDTRLGHILELVGLIGAGILAWKVTKTFMDSISTITTLLSNPSYAIAIGVVLTITGFAMAFKGMATAIKEGLEEFDFAEIIGGSLLGVGGAAWLGAKIATWITTAFAGTTVATALKTAIATLLGKAVTELTPFLIASAGGMITAAVSAIILGLGAYFVGIYDAIVRGIKWLSAALITFGAVLAGAGIGLLIGLIGWSAGPIGAAIGAAVGLVVGGLTAITIFVIQYWDEICAFLGTIASWVYDHVILPVWNFFEPLRELLATHFSYIWDDIVAVWDKVAAWFDENVIQPIVKFFEPVTTLVSEIFSGCWIIIQAVWLIASTWFNDNVVTPIVEYFKGLWEDVSKFFSDLWADISKLWKKVSAWFNENVVVPVVDFFRGVWTEVSGFFVSLWDDIKTVWNNVATWFSETVVEPVKSVFQKACKAIADFFTPVWLSIRQGVAGAMNGVIGAIESALNWVIKGLNNLIGGFDKIVKWAAEIIGEDWGGMTLVKEVKFSRIAVPTYAEGGFPEQGQMFIAREAGAEMVGNIGRRTAVANNDQIVSGIAGGVAEANEEQNVLLREQNALLRAILEKDSGTYLDGKHLTQSVEKYQRERGRVLITGGVV